MSDDVTKKDQNTSSNIVHKKLVQTGVPTKTVSIAAFLGLLTTYTHFFGLSYRKSYLEGAGFESVTVNLSPNESIYYAIEGLSQPLLKILASESLFFSTSNLIPGIVFSAMFPILWLVNKFSPLNNKDSSSEKENSLQDKVHSWVQEFPNSKRRTLMLSIISFFMGYVSQVVLIALLVFVLSLLWIFMSMGISLGERAGGMLVETPICKTIQWEKRKSERAIGCREIQVKGQKEPLIGKRMHFDSNVTYFLTNEGSYELSKDKEIISFRPIHIKGKEDIQNLTSPLSNL